MAFFKNGVLIELLTSTATSGGTLTLTAASQTTQRFTGSTNHNLKLPVATTLSNNRRFVVLNRSTGTITIQYNDATTLATLLPGSYRTVTLTDNSTSNGVWDAGFDFKALAPLTTDGDLLTYQSGAPVALPAKSNKRILQLESGIPAWVPRPTDARNYLESNPDANDDVAGYSTYADLSIAQPVDATGGVPNVTWTRTTSSPLYDVGSFLFTKDAANRIGQGVSFPFTIQRGDLGKSIRVTGSYEIASGTYADGDLTIWLIEDTGGTPVAIQPSGSTIQNVASGTIGNFVAEFQTTNDSAKANYRLAFHVSSSSAAAYTVKFDDLRVGRQSIQYGVPVTDWVSYTPTGVWTGTYTGRWRQIGDSMEVEAAFTATGAVSGTQTFSLPPGYSIDTSKFALTASNETTALGIARFDDAGVANYPGSVVYSSPTSVQVFTILASGSYAQDDTATATKPFTWASGDKLTAKFTVPILGWSSTVRMSNDTDTRVVAAALESGTASLSSSFSDVSFTAISDTHGAFNGTTTYTIPVPGYYKFSAQARFSSSGVITATNAIGLQLLKNGVSVRDCSDFFLTATAQWNHLVYEGRFAAGDTIKLQAKNQNSNPTFGSPGSPVLYIERLTGPSTIAASETVAAKYTGSVNAAISTTQPIQWGTKEYDSHGAVTTGSAWKFTAPVSGLYEVKCCVSSTTGTGNNTFIYKNGVITNTIMIAINAGTNDNGSGMIRLLAGDYIDIRPGVSLTANAVTEAHISITRVGNYV